VAYATVEDVLEEFPVEEYPEIASALGVRQIIDVD
jgi:hypothetical protein